MRKEYIVFSQRLAGELMIRGFVLQRMDRTTKGDSKRNVFFFNESEGLLRFIKEYKNK
jgi:hypothetical protein